MKFEVLHKIFKEKFKTDRLADISKELGVTPQVVSNWKSRNHVPYKYVKKLREIEKALKAPSYSFDTNYISTFEKEKGNTKILIEVINLYQKVLKRKKIFFTSLSVFFVLSLLYLIYYHVPIYTSTGIIIPAAESNKKSQLGGLAKQFGLSAPSSSNSILSRDVYPSIIRSYNFLDKLLSKEHKYKNFENIKLINIVMNSDTTNRSWDNFQKLNAVQKLRSKILVILNKKTSIISIRVTTDDPILSRDIAKNVIYELDLSLKKFEENQLTEKLDYISIRINEVSRALENAEDNLKVFREKNRRISSSPQLLLEEDRLVREVDVQMEIFTTLKTELELTQVQLIKRSNLILTIDTPRMPLYQTNSSSSRVLILSLVFGLFSSVIVAIIPDWVKDNMQAP